MDRIAVIRSPDHPTTTPSWSVPLTGVPPCGDSPLTMVGLYKSQDKNLCGVYSQENNTGRLSYVRREQDVATGNRAGSGAKSGYAHIGGSHMLSLDD